MRAHKFAVRDTTPVRALERLHEAPGVVVPAFVESEHLLVNVGVQMERASRDIRPFQRSLEARPKVLNRVRMDAPVDVLDHVVNEGVLEGWKVPVRPQGVGVEQRDERDFRVIGNDHCTDLGWLGVLAAVHDTENGRLACCGAVRQPLASGTGTDFRRPRLAADIRFHPLPPRRRIARGLRP
jgi:hypothetical protein